MSLLPTCEEFEGRLSLCAHYFDLAEEREGDAVGVLGESLDVPAESSLRVPELSAGEGQDVEVGRSQIPVQVLQGHVAALRVLAVTRHVYNQRYLRRKEKPGCNYDHEALQQARLKSKLPVSALLRYEVWTHLC